VGTALRDLYAAGCDIVTSRSTCGHRCVTTGRAWVKPEEFVEHEQFANALGFAGVLAAPWCGPRIGQAGCTPRRRVRPAVR